MVCVHVCMCERGAEAERDKMAALQTLEHLEGYIGPVFKDIVANASVAGRKIPYMSIFIHIFC